MGFLHWHRWSQWKEIGRGEGTYVVGGGTAIYLVQTRKCVTCGKIEIDKQVV